VDVANAPQLVLFYRSVLQLVGGAGFAIIMLSSITGPSGSGLSAAEGRDDQLAPHVRQSANIVLRLYLLYVVLGIIALILAGMDWFGAINHAFTAVATGGFSTRVESLAYYNSPLIEAIVIVLMIAGMLNFLTVYVLIRGKREAFFRNGEVRVLALLLIAGILLLLFGATIPVYDSLEFSIRAAVFEFVSALSTTGLTIVTDFYASWPQFGWFILTIAMLVGGSSGSTAGGIKLFRIYVLFKAVRWEIRKSFLPEHAVNQAIIWKGDQRSTLNDGQIRRTALFTFVYMLFYFLIVLLTLTQGDYSVSEVMFETASAISGVGISVGITHPGVPDAQLWIQSFGMLLGRLEFFAFMIGIIKLGRDTIDLFKPIEQ
jgi:trk system potassium uptake protein TrkH